jgi:hypothetical protein
VGQFLESRFSGVEWAVLCRGEYLGKGPPGYLVTHIDQLGDGCHASAGAARCNVVLEVVQEQRKGSNSQLKGERT